FLSAALGAGGVSGVCGASPVPAGHGADAVRAVRHLALAGLNVTMPHKADAAWACDVLTPEATALGVVNLVTRRDDGLLEGASTDGEGLVRAARAEGFEPQGRRALVVGAGGAARAIALALAGAGADVTVAARRRDAAETVAGLVPRGEAVLLSDADPGDADLVVQATPVGMRREAPLLDPGRLNRSQLL